jgi:sugar phosphate isomerase/epimerase
MKLGFFNIAWDKSQDRQIAKLLKKYDFEGIEVAPAKVWDIPTKATKNQIKEYRDFWQDHGISIVSMCSLFFPEHELNFFKGPIAQSKMLDYFEKITEIAVGLGAKKLVFGSPKNREYHQKDLLLVDEIARIFFSKLAQIAEQKQLILCIEPIPMQYGTRFINSISEALTLVEAVNHPAFRFHLDTGAATINQENIELLFPRLNRYLEHVHLSEDYLGELGQQNVDHRLFAKLFQKYKYSEWKVVEMRSDNNSDNIGQIERVLAYVKKTYDFI